MNGQRDIDKTHLSLDNAEERGFILSNADVTVVCQKPKLAAYIGEMQGVLARACLAGNDQVNVKATTTEKMGFTGRMEGISCHAVVLLEKSKDVKND